MKVYDVVVASNPEELANKVNEKIEQGYAPFGNISISSVVEKYNTVSTVYVQAVALVPEEECHCDCCEKEEKQMLVEPANAPKPKAKKPVAKKKK